MADIARLNAALEGRYRIERELGAGGMASVYLAEDLKHQRRVAIKVLRPELAAVIGAERFLVEIRTTANLQHPHILPLHDSGEVNGTVFYVMPFVEGESLRDRLARERQLPIDDAIRIATEVGQALDYAHRHGVIHRDIKPENILLHDGRALVADFGIALAANSAGGRMTEAGMSLGTPDYMSPEQAMGEQNLDARTDVYSLGCVLYEMLIGQTPFTGPTAQAIVARVMTEKPAPIRPSRERVPEPVEDAVLTALEKLPADRFQSAAAFVAALSGPVRARAGATSGGRTWLADRRTWLLLAVAGLATAAAAVAPGRRNDSPLAAASFLQRTFADEAVFTARFTRDGETIVYSAAVEGNTPRIFVIRSDYPEPRPLSDSGMHLLSVSSRDELAVLVGARFTNHRFFTGTLARMPLGGGAPRELLADVREADWSPDGAELAIIHEVNGKDRLEYPLGTVLFESGGYLSDLRVSPDGNRVAFLEHPFRYDDRGDVAIVDRGGAHTTLATDYWALEGLAWTTDGSRILYSGAADQSGGFYQIYSVTMGGKAELVLPSAGSLTMQDISPDGSWLITRDDQTTRVMVRAPGQAAERNLGWLDSSFWPRLSADGELLAFNNQHEDAGANYAAMMRKTDGSPAVRLGAGNAGGISPDKRWVLGMVPTTPAQLWLYPTGPGESRRLDSGELAAIVDADFFPDGVNLLVCGNEPKHATRCYVRPVAAGPLRPVTPEGIKGRAVISPDGSTVLAQSVDGWFIYPIDGSDPRAVPSLGVDEFVVRWSPDGHSIWTTRENEFPLRVEQLDPATGRRQPLLSIEPATRAGVLGLSDLALADDPRWYAYLVNQYVSRVFVVTGMQ